MRTMQNECYCNKHRNRQGKAEESPECLSWTTGTNNSEQALLKLSDLLLVYFNFNSVIITAKTTNHYYSISSMCVSHQLYLHLREHSVH